MAPEPCLAVPCPLCRASAGEPCHELTRERKTRKPHRRRWWWYQRECPQGDLFAGVAG